MKSNYVHVMLFTILATAIISCESTRHFNNSYNNEIKLGKDNTSEVFIIKKDGEKIKGKKMTFSHFSNWRVVQKESWIAVDGQKVNFKDIGSYQSADGYYSFYEYNKKMEGQQYIFLPRIRHGKISIYYSSASTIIGTAQTPGVDHNVYYFEKANEKIQLFTFPEFREAIKDNAKALEKLNEVFPKGRIPENDHVKNLQKLASVADVYNS